MIFRLGLGASVFLILASCTPAIVFKNDDEKVEISQNFKEDVPLYTPELIPPKGLRVPIPRCEARITVFTGLYDDGIREWKEFRVQVCDLPLDLKLLSLGLMLQSQGWAQGAQWTQLFNDDWLVTEHRVPQTDEDFEAFNKEGRFGLQRRVYVYKEGLPKVLLGISQEIRDEIISFIAYPNGALEIMLFSNREAIAQKVLNAVNVVLKSVR